MRPGAIAGARSVRSRSGSPGPRVRKPSPSGSLPGRDAAVDPPGPGGLRVAAAAAGEREQRRRPGRRPPASLLPQPPQGRRRRRPARDPGGRDHAEQRRARRGPARPGRTRTAGRGRRSRRPGARRAGRARRRSRASARTAAGSATASAAPASTAPTVTPSAPVARSRASVGRALAGHEAEALDERIQAHERVDDGHDAQQRGQRAEEGAVARRGAADRGGLRAERRQPSRDRGAVGAARELDHDLRSGARVGGQHARRAHVGDAAVVVERADGPDDAEARLAAARQLDGERRRPRRCPAPARGRRRPRPRRCRAGGARRRAGGPRSGVWSPGKARSLTGSPSAKESAPCTT